MEKALAPAPASATSASNVEKVPGKDDDALFPDIDSENPVTEMQSLCMNCEEQVLGIFVSHLFPLLSHANSPLPNS